jgi:hypothetical protein
VEQCQSHAIVASGASLGIRRVAFRAALLTAGGVRRIPIAWLKREKINHCKEGREERLQTITVCCIFVF